MRVLAVALVVAVGIAGTAAGNQLSAQPLAFEAVSIRENKTVSDEGIISGAGSGRFTVTNSSVASMIRYAYRLRDYQLLNAPDWASTTPYDVMATYPEGAATPTDDQIREMVQTLLADRFGLAVRRETRQLPAYELRIARNDGTVGAQLVPSTIDCALPPSRPGGFPVCQGFQTRSFIQGRGQTLDGLASALQAMVRQRVINRTGLAGAYDITVRWGEARGPAEQASVEEIAAMITALQDQLGLRLESIRAPEEVVVVAGVRRPSAN